MLKKMLTWGGIAFLIFFIAFRPNEAMGVVKTLGQTLVDVGNAVGEFFNSLVS